jgi:ketosteroid isomerase-like protein
MLLLLGYISPAGAQMDPKTFVQQVYATFAQDPSAALDMLSDDVEWILPDSPVDKKGRPEIAWLGRRQGRAQVEEFFQLLGEQVQMFEFTPREFYAEGNTVFVVLHERSICLQTKIAYTLDFVHKVVVGNDKVVSLENYLPTAPIIAAFRGDKSYPSWVILAPEEGEMICSGSNYTVQWEAHPQAVKFDLYFSMNNGITWHLIERDIPGTSYDWGVPMSERNRMKCRLKVIGYDSSGRKMGSAKSYYPFAIDQSCAN